MKKITLLLLVFVGFTLSSCQQEMILDQNSINDLFKADKNQKKPKNSLSFDIFTNLTDSPGCSEPIIMPLTAGQHIDVGTLEVSNDDEFVYVTYNVNNTYAGGPSDWYLEETHLFIGCDASEIPINGGGNPVIGHFPYSENHDPEKSITYKISLSDFDCDADCLVMSAHSSVITLDSNNEQLEQQTAFGGCNEDSSEFSGSRWGCYFDYCLNDCDEDKCEMAFGYKTDRPNRNYCFTIDDGSGDSYLGWTTLFALSYPNQSSWTHELNLYSNANQCDIENSNEANIIGTVIVRRTKELKLTFQYKINEDYKVCKINLYAGNEMYPINQDGSLNVPNSLFHTEIFDTPIEMVEGEIITMEWPDKNLPIYIMPNVEITPAN